MSMFRTSQVVSLCLSFYFPSIEHVFQLKKSKNNDNNNDNNNNNSNSNNHNHNHNNEDNEDNITNHDRTIQKKLTTPFALVVFTEVFSLKPLGCHLGS